MRLKELSATGNIDGTNTIHLGTVVLTAGSDAATLVIKDGGSSGTAIFTLKAAASTSVVVSLPGVQVGTAHATFTGTGPVASFSFE